VSFGNLARADRLRQAILKRAFEGRLVPQDPNDEPAEVLLARIQAKRIAPKSSHRAEGNDTAQVSLRLVTPTDE